MKLRISLSFATCYGCVYLLLTNLKEINMANDWIIDVLADLKTFATENGLTALAGQLEDTALVASTEISSQKGVPQELVNWEIGSTRRLSRTATAR